MKLSTLTISPIALGVSAVDLKAAINTQYKSGAFDISGCESFSLALAVTTSGGPTAGVAKLYAIGCDSDGTEMTGDMDIATAIVITTTEKVGLTVGKMSGVTSGISSTIAGSAAAVIGFPRAKFCIQITTANIGGTTAVGSLTAFVSHWN